MWNSTGELIRIKRRLVKSGPNQVSVSTIPSKFSNPWVLGIFAVPRDSNAQPGAVRARYPLQICTTPGSLPCARKVGDKVILTGWRVGEVQWGGYAERARVKADWLVHRPPGLSAAKRR